MKKLSLILILIVLLTSISGCFPIRGLKADVVVKHPDSSMLIIAIEKRGIRVAIYDAQQNKMIEYPQLIPFDHYLHGWTIHKYDWQKRMKKRESE